MTAIATTEPRTRSAERPPGDDRPAGAEPKPARTKRVHLTFAGLVFATPDDRKRINEAYRKALDEQMNSESGFDPARLPAQPPHHALVLRDEKGRLYLLAGGPQGAAAVPFKPGIMADPKDPYRTGGYLPASKFPSPPRGGEGPQSQQQQIVNGVYAYVESQQQQQAAGDASNRPGGPTTLDQLAGMLQQMGLGAAQQILGQLLAGDPAQVEQLVAGLTSSAGLGSMAGGMALGAGLSLATGALMGAWQVDDASSMGEQLAKHFAGQMLAPLQGHVQQMIAGQIGLADPAKAQSMSEKIDEFFNGPSSSATLQALCLTHTDVKGNAISAASGNVEAEGLALAREGDTTAPGGTQVYMGADTVLTNGARTARMDSQTQDGAFTTHAATVLIGGPQGGPPPPPKASNAAEEAAGAAAGAKGASQGSDEGSPENAEPADDEAPEETPKEEPRDQTLDDGEVESDLDPSNETAKETQKRVGGKTSEKGKELLRQADELDASRSGIEQDISSKKQGLAETLAQKQDLLDQRAEYERYLKGRNLSAGEMAAELSKFDLETSMLDTKANALANEIGDLQAKSQSLAEGVDSLRQQGSKLSQLGDHLRKGAVVGGGLAELWELEQSLDKIKALAQAGNQEEAWRVACANATKFFTSILTDFEKFPGVGNLLGDIGLGVVIGKLSEYGGTVIADATFDIARDYAAPAIMSGVEGLAHTAIWLEDLTGWYFISKGN